MSASFGQKKYVANILIKFLVKEEDQEKYLEEQCSQVLSGFSKKTSIDTYIEESRDCGKNPFLLEKRSELAKMFEREAELENHPVIKDIYDKYLDNWKHQFPIYKFLRKSYPAILKQDEMDYIRMMILQNYGRNVL